MQLFFLRFSLALRGQFSSGYLGSQALEKKESPLPSSIPVSATPMLMMGALCSFGKSSGSAVYVKLPSSFFVILNSLRVSPLASHAIKALLEERRGSACKQHKYKLLQQAQGHPPAPGALPVFPLLLLEVKLAGCCMGTCAVLLQHSPNQTPMPVQC